MENDAAGFAAGGTTAFHGMSPKRPIMYMPQFIACLTCARPIGGGAEVRGYDIVIRGVSETRDGTMLGVIEWGGWIW